MLYTCVKDSMWPKILKSFWILGLTKQGFSVHEAKLLDLYKSIRWSEKS